MRYPINSVIEHEDKLVELTLKYFREFGDIMGNSAGSTAYMGEVMAKALVQYDRCEQDVMSPMLSMACLDTKLTKALVTQRMQGFVDIIEEKLETLHLREQDDYYIEDLTTWEESRTYEQTPIEYVFWGKGPKTEVVTDRYLFKSFRVSNARSGFEGTVVMKYEWDEIFINDNDCYTTWVLDRIQFFVGDDLVMTIDYRKDYDRDNATRLGYEEVKIYHFKYVAAINSFYSTIKYS